MFILNKIIKGKGQSVSPFHPFVSVDKQRKILLELKVRNCSNCILMQLENRAKKSSHPYKTAFIKKTHLCKILEFSTPKLT